MHSKHLWSWAMLIAIGLGGCGAEGEPGLRVEGASARALSGRFTAQDGRVFDLAVSGANAEVRQAGTFLLRFDGGDFQVGGIDMAAVLGGDAGAYQALDAIAAGADGAALRELGAALAERGDVPALTLKALIDLVDPQAAYSMSFQDATSACSQCAAIAGSNTLHLNAAHGHFHVCQLGKSVTVCNW